jgi:hypothetical protein
MPVTEARLRVLREAPPDTWIALSEDESEIVGRGATYAEAVEQAAAHGVSDPVLIKTPADWTAHVLSPCA